MNRRLYRCRDNGCLAGVAGGMAEYFDLDPTLVRMLWFVSIFFGGLGLLLYIGMAIIVPLEPALGRGGRRGCREATAGCPKGTVTRVAVTGAGRRSSGSP